MLFFVKVRLDVTQIAELGSKLSSRQLDKSATKVTYCLADDPAVGMSIWEATDKAELDAKLAPFLPYYESVREIVPVLTADDAQRALMRRGS